MMAMEDLYRKSIEFWGKDYPLRQLAEECMELGQALLKYVRSSKNETPVPMWEAWEKVIEELADVDLCRSVMICGMNPEDSQKMYDVYAAKRDRYEERLKVYEIAKRSEENER